MPPLLAAGARWSLAWLLAHSYWGIASAQVYKFDAMPIPRARRLQTLYAFYVYNLDEAPAGKRQPYMDFSQFQGHSYSEREPDEMLTNYKGLQVSTLLFRDFWKVINASRYCSTENDVNRGQAQHAHQLLTFRGWKSTGDMLHSYTVRFGQKQAGMRIPIVKSGIYILIWSNCGDLNDAYVNGKVVVRNAYGFLPANDYYKMPFYGILALVYGFMTIVWTALCVRWRHELFNIQFCILGVLLLGLFEAFWWWALCMHFNASGLMWKWLLVLAILFTVMKSICSYMLVLVASLGWGVTRPHLERALLVKIQATAMLYIVLTFIREVVFAFRHSHTFSLGFILLVLLPVAILNGVIFYWIFTALGKLMEALEALKQDEKLALFRRLHCVLILGLCIASGTVMFQMYDAQNGIASRWHYQWFLSDGVSHIVFCMVLAAMMYLWAPHENSQRFAYSQQIPDDDSCDQEMPGPGRPQSRGAADLADFGEPGGSVAPAAATIGAHDADIGAASMS